MTKRLIKENIDVAGYTTRSDALDLAINESLSKKIAHIVEMKTERVLVPSLSYSYSIDGNRGTQILVTTTKIPVGTQQVTSGAKTAEVLFIDGYKVLIKSDSVFDTTDTLNVGGKVLQTFDNIKGRAPTIGDFGYMSLRQNKDQVHGGLDFIMSGVTLNASKLRKIRATATQEFMQDVEAVYGKKDIEDKFAEFTLAEAMYEVDSEIINFLHDSAVVENTTPIDLGQLIATGAFNATQELYRLVEASIGKIAEKTIRPPKVFVLSTPLISSFLCAHPQFIPAVSSSEENTAYVRGEIMGTLIITDSSKTLKEDFMIVGTYNEKDPTMSAVVLGIYNIVDKVVAIEPSNGQVNIFTTLRYDVRHNPLDTKISGSSSFIRRYVFDVANVAPIPPVPPLAPFTTLTLNNIQNNALTMLEQDTFVLDVTTDADLLVVASDNMGVALTEGDSGKTIRTLRSGAAKIKLVASRDGYQDKVEEINLTVRARPITTLEIQTFAIELDENTFTQTIPVATNAPSFDVEVDNDLIVEVRKTATNITIESKAVGSTKVRLTAQVQDGKLVEKIISVKVASMPVTTLSLSQTSGNVTIGSSLNPLVIDVNTNGTWRIDNKAPTIARVTRNRNKIEINPIIVGAIEFDVISKLNAPGTQEEIVTFTGQVLPQPITNLVVTSANPINGSVGNTDRITIQTDANAVTNAVSDDPLTADVRKISDTEFEVEFLQAGNTEIEITSKAFDAVASSVRVQVDIQ